MQPREPLQVGGTSFTLGQTREHRPSPGQRVESTRDGTKTRRSDDRVAITRRAADSALACRLEPMNSMKKTHKRSHIFRFTCRELPKQSDPHRRP
jgi:hypothetical protein